MARTDLDVCNLAIARVGAETIDTLDETTPQGAYCVAEYPQCRDWLLSKYRWAFANGVKQLAPRADTPADCPAPYAYDFPADLVGAIHAYRSAADPRQGSPISAQPVNGYIAAHGNPMFVEYTRRVPESAWPTWFVELVKTVFAAGMAAAVGQNGTLGAQLLQLAFGTPEQLGEGGLYATARNEDSRMAPARQAFQPWDDGALVNARYGWGYGPGVWSDFPFVGLPGSFGPPTFIDFSGG